MNVYAMTLAGKGAVTGVWTHMELAEQILRSHGVNYKILFHPVNLRPPPRSHQRAARLLAMLTRTPFEDNFFRWLVRPEMTRTLRGELKRSLPDVIHIHGTFCGGLLADFINRTGIPWVVHIHSVDSELMRAAGHPPGHSMVDLADHLLQKSIEAATVSVAVSEDLKGRIAGLGIDVSGVRVIHNPIMLPCLPVLEGTSEEYVYLPARFSPEKGVDIALKAWALVEKKLPEVHLFIAGAGPEEGSLRSMARDLGLARVRFLGSLSWERNMAWMAGSLFVLQTTVPRGGFRESCPLVTAEAMTLGKPVVTSDTGGGPEIMGDAGIHVPPFDHEALAGAIITLLRDETLRLKLAKMSEERARNLFDPGAYAGRMMEVFDEAIALASEGHRAL